MVYYNILGEGILSSSVAIQKDADSKNAPLPQKDLLHIGTPIRSLKADFVPQ